MGSIDKVFTPNSMVSLNFTIVNVNYLWRKQQWQSLQCLLHARTVLNLLHKGNWDSEVKGPKIQTPGIWLYPFPRVSLTNDHGLDVLEQEKFIIMAGG